MNLGQTIAASKDRWQRKPADFYATPPETTQVLCDYFALAPHAPKMHILEPCCGEGHMSEILKANGHEVTSSDIRHTGYGVGGVDYIATPEASAEHYSYDAVITNPPFDQAEAIIRRALRDAPIVAMLLSNNYWHAESRRVLFDTRPPEAILALTWRPAFLEAERGSSPLANMVWTIWNDSWEGNPSYTPVRRPASVPPAHVPGSPVLLGRTGLLGELEKALARRIAL